MACVGSATANELNKLGITPDLMPERFQQEGLIEEFKALISSKAAYNGTKISMLYPKGKRGASLGPVTKKTIEEYGLKCHIMPHNAQDRRYKGACKRD